MNHWRQRKTYRCSGCGESYLHDTAYTHASFECPARIERTESLDQGKTRQPHLLVGHPCRQGRLTCTSGPCHKHVTTINRAR